MQRPQHPKPYGFVSSSSSHAQGSYVITAPQRAYASHPFSKCFSTCCVCSTRLWSHNHSRGRASLALHAKGVAWN